MLSGFRAPLINDVATDLTDPPTFLPATGIGGLPASEGSWFEVQTTDGAWHNATGVALSPDAKRLVLTVPGAGALTAAATRGFWSPWPVVVLFSAEGLPALPWWEPVGMVCEPGGYVAC